MTGIAALLGALGLVGIAFGLLSFLLALFGMPTELGWVVWNLVVGVGLLGSAAVINFDALRERLSSGEARRAGKYGTSAVLSTVLSIAILAALGFLATRYHWRYDASEQKIHSLSDQSRKVLRGLERDVEVLALFPTLDQQPVRDLLDRYSYQSSRFKVEYADPNERPDLLQRYGIAPEDLGNGIVRIALGDDSVNVDEVTEENVTNAMVKLSRTSEKLVYFLEGHNERPVEDEAAKEQRGYARAAEALRNETYRVETLLLAAKGDVPEDANVVIVAGATRPLLPQESAALTRYLARGGALLVMVDPRANTDLGATVRGWGVELGEDIVVDRALALFGRATTPFASRYDPTHEITRDLRETTLFHIVRSVKPVPGAESDFTEIVFTGQDSWAERDLDRFFAEGAAEFGEGDLRGPVPIAVVGTPHLDGSSPGEAEAQAADAEGEDAGAEKERGRLAVFGDSDFAANDMLEGYRNRDLFVNTVNWLMGDVEAISIRPNRARASRFQLSTQQFERIRWLSLFLAPQALAVIGVVVWWSRRRTAGR